MMETKVFPCSTEGLESAQEFLSERCSNPKPAIVMDEIVSNIVRCSGATSFSISFERGETSITLEFTDDGVAFDPTKDAASPDVDASVNDRKIGGLGIFMVKKMSKSVTYRRDGEKNVLTVVM